MSQKNAERKVDALLRNPSIHLMNDLRWVVRQHLLDLFKVSDMSTQYNQGRQIVLEHARGEDYKCLLHVLGATPLARPCRFGLECTTT